MKQVPNQAKLINAQPVMEIMTDLHYPFQIS